MKAFRCSRTGVLFPEDYVEEWGRKYGIGLGPTPISEALVNDYHRPVCGDGESAMHALSNCRSQVDLVEVTEEEFEAGKAILEIDDVGMRKRGPFMRDKQLMKSIALRNKFPEQIAAAEKRLGVVRTAA